jgi:hypothetical protein
MVRITCWYVKRKEQTLNFRADDDLARALVQASRAHERSVSAEIRFALRKHLSNESASPTKADASKDVASKEPVGDKV